MQQQQGQFGANDTNPPGLVGTEQTSDAPATVVWYIQSGTIQGTSEQEDSVEGLVSGFLSLVNDKPWAALGEIVYGSKRGFESDNPYLIPTFVIAASMRQSKQGQNLNSSDGPITNIVGGIN